MAQEESEDYKKLHDKLNLIESKIADMKRHVQKKKDEKAKLMEQKRERQRKREERERDEQQYIDYQQQNGGNKKVDLKQFVTSVPEHKELHTFEKNPYSPKHNLYYISEIIKSYKD